jgi:hypothetical protein
VLKPVTDPRLQSVVQTAIARFHEAGRGAAQRCVEAMDRALLSGMRSDTERFVWQLAVQDLRRKLAPFNTGFAGALRDITSAEMAARGEAVRRFEDTDWRSLSLVEDAEADQRVSVDRLTRDLAAECEWELRELDSYVLAVQRAGPSERQRNPLRPEVVAKALVQAADGICDDKPARQVLARELARALAPSMRTAYAAITDDLRKRGVQPISLTVRTVDGPGNEIARDTVPDSGYQTLNPKREVRPHSHAAQTLSAMFGVALPPEFNVASHPGDPGPTEPSSYSDTPAYGAGAGGGPYAGGGGHWSGGGGGGGWGSSPGGGGWSGGSAGAGQPGGGAPGPYQASDAQMLDVIRRLVQVAGAASDLGAWQASGPGGQPHSAYPRTVPDGTPSGRDSITQRLALPAMMDIAAGNLIRLHRDELQRAATGSLDHMVIDIVAALFDQVLADPKIPPQMARQIARLQLPVLRVALKDTTFFSSRRHPVRRLVNRIATLAVAFDNFDTGLGRELLDKVRRLVQEIIEGDFDQISLYEVKLMDLEALVAEQTASKSSPHAEAAALLSSKETMLRVQQRYTLALKEQLANVVAEDFARDFLSQVWSQVVVFTTMRDGPEAPLTQRMKLAGRDMVLSLQPKGTPQERKEFLVKLPQMMRDLNEGLDLIRWSPRAKRDFFSKLLPAHAQSLKTAPMTDFAMRQLKHQLDQVDKVAIPKPSEIPLETVPAALGSSDTDIPLAFTEEEARRVGLVDESAIDSEGNVALDLDLGEEVTTDVDTEPAALHDNVDLDLDAPAPPDRGEPLIHHMQPGCAYLMHLDKRGWRKVRLDWVSPSRGFFVFSHGRKQTKTVSLTARMLTNMLRNNRFRAFEQSELIERATARARRQLASLSATTPKH